MFGIIAITANQLFSPTGIEKIRRAKTEIFLFRLHTYLVDRPAQKQGLFGHMLIIGSCLCLFPNFQRNISGPDFCRENGKSIILKLGSYILTFLHAAHHVDRQSLSSEHAEKRKQQGIENPGSGLRRPRVV